MTFGVFASGLVGAPVASAARGKITSTNCPPSSTAITVGPYSVVCSGQASTGATITITKATSQSFVAHVALAAGTTMKSASMSLNSTTGNSTTGDCLYTIGIAGGTTQPVTILVGGGVLEANLDQTGGTLNPGDPSCVFTKVRA